MALTNEDLMAISNLMDQKIHPINNRLDRMEIRLDRLESDMSAMKVGQAELSRQIKEIDQKVSNAYQLALDAWGTGVENRNWLETSRLNA